MYNVNEFSLGYTRQRTDTLLLSDAMQPGRNLDEPPPRLHSITSQRTQSSQSPPLDLQTIVYRTSSFASTTERIQQAVRQRLISYTILLLCHDPMGYPLTKLLCGFPSPSPMTVHGKNPTKS